MQLLEDPTRAEVRQVFAAAEPGVSVEFRRYSRNRAMSWAFRYGWKVSTRKTAPRGPYTGDDRDFVLVFCEKRDQAREKPVGKAQVLGVRQRLDNIPSAGALQIAPVEREVFLAAFRTLKPKAFELIDVEGDEVWVRRLTDEGEL